MLNVVMTSRTAWTQTAPHEKPIYVKIIYFVKYMEFVMKYLIINNTGNTGTNKVA